MIDDETPKLEETQGKIDEAIKALRELNDHGYSILKKTEGRPFKLSRRRHVYLLGLYASAIAQVQGYICLVENKQYRVSHNQARTLYEIWVNTNFLYCSRSNIYAWHMILMSDKQKLERAAKLLADGHIEQGKYDEHEKTYLRRKTLMAKKYPTWPDAIPDVTNGSAVPADAKQLFNLRQRCKTIDFYNAKYKRGSRKSMTMDKHYANLYPFLSSGTHADPIELSSIFTETDTAIYANLDGSNDADGALRMTIAVYVFQYDMVRRAKRYIAGEDPPRMPSWIDVYAKQIGLIK